MAGFCGKPPGLREDGSFTDMLRDNGFDVHKDRPEGDLHARALELYVRTFPYVIGQGSSWLTRQVIRMMLYRTLLKGIRSESPQLSRHIRKAFRFNANTYAETLLFRNQVVAEWENFFRKYDFLICPVAFGPAFKRCKIGSRLKYEDKEMIYVNYTWPYVACFNATGHPSVTIPLGLGKEGLPIGVQVVGRYWSEPMLLDIAKKFSRLTEGFIQPEQFRLKGSGEEEKLRTALAGALIAERQDSL